eukprot:TRINITY_DN59465_c0_g1_i1.p1 TRINITY_DN59465_c0_g1~~TRINITY_DN59465_c0_g1_i1.p1  ORF type:complete len:252 (-),score=119.31 TRINITY_DN59465_c0_g1_i1:116-871(-)
MSSSKHAVLARSSSTSSLFIDSAIINPHSDEIIMGVSTMLHCQMVRDIDSSHVRKNKFPYFAEERYANVRTNRNKIPDAEKIFAWLSEVFQVGEFYAEVAVVTLVYINRLIGLVNMPLTASNWKPVTITALLVAQKVWDDSPLANADFSILYPVLNVNQINYLEVKFLLLLQYKLTVSSSLYARYYFELRSISDPYWSERPSKPWTTKLARRKPTRQGDVALEKRIRRRKETPRALTVEDLPGPGPRYVIS